VGVPRAFTATAVTHKTGKPSEQVSAGMTRWGKAQHGRKGRAGEEKISAAIPPPGERERRWLRSRYTAHGAGFAGERGLDRIAGPGG
jgi:hypothetical protein